MKPHDLKSPNLWVLTAAVLAVIGIITFVLGWVGQVTWLRFLGAAMFAPLIIGGLVIIAVVIPVLIAANRRMRKKDTHRTE